MILLYYFGEYGVSFFLRFVLRKILKYCTKSRGSNLVYTDSCGLCKNTLYYTHIYTGGKSMAEEIRFVSGQMPSLLYATKQIVAASAITRAIHRHERFTEMLYVYQGAGQYIAGGYSYPIRTGDILLYIKVICMSHLVPAARDRHVLLWHFRSAAARTAGRAFHQGGNGLCVRRWTRSTTCKHSAN